MLAIVLFGEAAIGKTASIVGLFCGADSNLELAIDDKGKPDKGRTTGSNQKRNQKYWTVI